MGLVLGLGLDDFIIFVISSRIVTPPPLPGSEGWRYDSMVCFDKDLKYLTFSTLALLTREIASVDTGGPS